MATNSNGEDGTETNRETLQIFCTRQRRRVDVQTSGQRGGIRGCRVTERWDKSSQGCLATGCYPKISTGGNEVAGWG